MRTLPVTGSSTDGKNPDGSLDWAPTEKAENFRPLERWSEWTAEQHERFNAVAGPAMTALGYQLEPGAGSGGSGSEG